MANNTNATNGSKDTIARIVILIITLVFAIAFILLAVFVRSPRSDNYGDGGYGGGHSVSGTLSTGYSGTRITISNDVVYYRFTPTMSTTYRFYSESSNGDDPKATLYDSNWTTLASDDDGGVGRNFSVSYRLVAGNTYYLGVSKLGGSSSSSITITVYVE